MNILISLIMASALTAAAAPLLGPKETYESFKCKSKLTALEHEWLGVGDWKGHVTVDGTMGLIRKTSKFAHWIVLENVNGVETLTLMNSTNARKVTFNSKCESALKIYAHKHFSNPKGLDDARLLKEMVDHPKGVVALWSPGMGHSADSIQRLQKVSGELKLPIIFALDPFADEKVAKKFLADEKIKDVSILKLASLELFYRDATMHYPNFLVYRDGEIKGHVHPGLMSEERYKNSILKLLGQK